MGSEVCIRDRPILMEKEEWKDGELINPSDENGGRQPGAMVKTGEWETVNKANAIWARAKKDITPEQYTEFYKEISQDFEAVPYTHLTLPTNRLG